MHRFFSSLLLVAFLSLLSLEATDCIPDCSFNTDWTLEVRGAYFQLNGSSIKKVTSDSWLDYEVETAKRVHPFVEVFGGLSWATKECTLKKRSGPYHHLFKTTSRISILPVTLGLKAIYPILPFVDIYAGAGVCYSFLKIGNHCHERHLSYEGLSRPPYKKSVIKNNVGGLFKVGVQIAMSSSTFLDFFTDYYTQTFSFPKKNRHSVFKNNLDCSGFKFGAGFGVYF